MGNLTAVTDANAHTTAYTYDARNRRLSETNPLGQATSFTYDSVGNLLTRQKPDGATIEYVYDTRNRRTETRYPDGTRETATYDAAGRIIAMGNATTSETKTYDANGRPVSVTDQHMGAISYTYDAVGNRTSVTDPDGGIQRFVYDELNRLRSFTDPTGGVTSYQYDELNRPIRTTLPNGVTTSRGYDDDNRLQQVRTVDPVGTVLALFDYTYDAVGNRTTMTEEDGGTTSYTYDNRYQVIEVDYPEGRVADATGAGDIEPLPGFERFIYDAVGNRLSRQTDTTTTTYEYDAANRMIRGGDAIYRYDANGNRIAKEDAGLYRYHTEHPDVSYQYDYEDRLIRIVEQQLHPTNRTAHGEDLPAGLTRKPALQFVTEYRYDAAGRRVEKHTGPSFSGMLEGTVDDVRFEQVRYLYDGLEVLHEHSSRQDHQTIAFYRAGGRLVAQFRYATSDGFGSGQFPRMYLDYYSHDGLGSVATLTHYEDDESHQPIRYRYSAFGAIVQGDFTNNPYGYTSRRFDHENGFYHYHFRKYDPVTGTWLTPDPIGIGGGINLYRFVSNNPVNHHDWLGLEVVPFVGDVDLNDYVREAGVRKQREAACDGAGARGFRKAIDIVTSDEFLTNVSQGASIAALALSLTPDPTVTKAGAIGLGVTSVAASVLNAALNSENKAWDYTMTLLGMAVGARYPGTPLAPEFMEAGANTALYLIGSGDSDWDSYEENYEPHRRDGLH